MMGAFMQCEFRIAPEYVVPRFVPGADVEEFIRKLSRAVHHNRVLYEFASATGWPVTEPPCLVREAQLALNYARIVRRFPAAERVARIVLAQRVPVPTVTLAVEINASVRTAYNYAAALEAAGVLHRPSPKGGWIVAERWN